MTAPEGLADSVHALAALDDPSRRRLYELVRVAAAPVSREQAAAEMGISRKLAGFHLDRLVEVGLLIAGYDRAARHRTLGRTPKTYRTSSLELRISIPQRHPELLAELLLQAISSARPEESARDAAMRTVREAGRRLGNRVHAVDKPGRLGAERAVTTAETILRERGYEPQRVSPGRLRLRNCPFRPLAEQATDLVCGLNEQLMTGIVEGLNVRSVHAVFAPRPGHCCVELRAAGTA